VQIKNRAPKFMLGQTCPKMIVKPIIFICRVGKKPGKNEKIDKAD